MRNPRILNRPMFNPNASAYGRGIASNLVSEEERIRFNAGGRVGLWKGSELVMKIPGFSKIIKKLTPDKSYGKYLTDKISQIGKPSSAGGYGGTGWGATEVPWFKSIAGKGIGLGKGIVGKAKRSPLLWGLGGGALGLPFLFGGDKEEIEETEVDPQWKKRLQTKATKGEKEIEKGLYSPKEKEEKKSQMALAIAERLIGGSRDKWGSKAQMENIAGGLKDIREIADPSERREMQAKYKAYWKGQEKMEKSRYERETSYAGAISKGLDHPQALQATTGISGTLTLSADPDLRENQIEKINERGPGTIFFDEKSNSWNILTPDGKSVKVTVDQIEGAFKSGAIDEMRNPEKPEKKEEDLIAETETLDIDNPVTLAGTKPIIDTSEPKVNAVGMPFFN